jgi:glycosyltransferase involved in cell wall biosynthesis
MFKVCVDGTPVRGKLTGIGVYTLNLIDSLYQLQEEENFQLDVYFHPSVKNWLLRKSTIPEHLKPYDPIFQVPIPVTLANSLAKYPNPILSHLERSLDKPNIIHGTDHYVYPYQKSNKIMTIHDLTFLKYPEYSTTIVQGYLERIKRCLKWTDLVITFSENTKKDLIELLNISPEKIYIVPQASRYSEDYITPNLFYKNKDFIDYFLYKPYLLFVSTLEPRKNIINLIEAFNHLKEVYKIPHQLILIGKKGWKYESIFAKIEQSKWKEDIQHLDYLSDEMVALFYNQADAFIYPSYYEGFGLPVLEAMTLGTPVITSNTSSLPQVAGDAALFINPDDYCEIAETILSVINDSNLRNKMIKKGKQRAKLFSWKTTAKETIKAYQLIL